MKVRTILDQVDLGSMALPEFQRGYVWNREQVRGLMASLYRKYPVGSLLFWITKSEDATTRGDGQLAPGVVKLLLDGQQRITSLYGIIRGKAPQFFDGNAQSFTGLHFNLDEETFEFYAPAKMKGNPVWIDVTGLMKQGAGAAIGDVVANPALQANLTTYITRLNAVDQIKDIDLYIEDVVGADKTVDVVVDIFNRVNSGGTKLSKGDLALAKICGEWPHARAEMKKRLLAWSKAGFYFKLEWLLRIVNCVYSGQAYFTGLEGIKPAEFEEALTEAENLVDRLLNMIDGRLGLDHDRVLGSRYSFPLLARYLHQLGGYPPDTKERDGLLYWYVHTFLWGRYSGSTESVLAQDLTLISGPDGALHRLINQLHQHRGDLRLHADDFAGWSKGARFYPLLYMMTRACHAKDWAHPELELSENLLGRMSRLELHHIFPKALLKKHGYSRPEVNAIANFTFLTKETNLLVSDRDPAEYLQEFASKHPRALESHWIPLDKELWKVKNYGEFLAERRRLLAKAANKFLDGLQTGSLPEPEVAVSVLERAQASGPDGTESEEDQTIAELDQWLVERGLPQGEAMFELSDPGTGEALAVLDLAWPDGLQEGYSHPVALLLDQPEEVKHAANRAGYRFFTDPAAFKDYVQREVLAVEQAPS
jgi:hypothetical protein